MPAIVALAVALTLATASCSGYGAPTPTQPTLPGSAGHFDNGELSFDYPTDWPVLAGGFSSGGVMYVLAVLGVGTWREGCVQSGNVLSCGPDSFNPSPGGILVKVYRWWGGPMVPCRGDVDANATFGSLAVRERVDGDKTTWEIRAPGNEFGQPNNVFIEAHTSTPARLAQAEAMVASFHWGPSVPGDVDMCATSPSGSPAA